MALSRFFENLRAADGTTVLSMMWCFFSSIFLGFMSSIVIAQYGFRYATTLTCFYFTCTFLLSLVASKVGSFEIKKLPIVQVSKLAALAVVFICLSRFSLRRNSLGFYKVMKVMVLPATVAIESVLYQKYQSAEEKAALTLVCLGVIFISARDFRMSPFGSICAVANVLVSSFSMIWIGTLIESLDCSALQLLTYVAPLSALLSAPFMPLFDNWQASDSYSIWNYKFEPSNLAVLAFAGCVAFLFNVSRYLVIGKSSAVSYNVLLLFQAVVVLFSDFVLFGRPTSFKTCSSTFLTLSGVVWYLSLKLEKARVQNEERGQTYRGINIEVVSGEETEVLVHTPVS